MRLKIIPAHGLSSKRRASYFILALYEGFGFPLLEGQVCGTPVMAANTSSLPEIAGGGALLVDPEDVTAMAQSMRLIAEDGDLRCDLRNVGYENVQRFTWEKAANQVLLTLVKAAVS